MMSLMQLFLRASRQLCDKPSKGGGHRHDDKNADQAAQACPKKFVHVDSQCTLDRKQKHDRQRDLASAKTGVATIRPTPIKTGPNAFRHMPRLPCQEAEMAHLGIGIRYRFRRFGLHRFPMQADPKCRSRPIPARLDRPQCSRMLGLSSVRSFGRSWRSSRSRFPIQSITERPADDKGGGLGL